METTRKLIQLLRQKNLTLGLAESASAGYTAYLLTKIPGASQVFKGGFVVYSLDTKNILFKIPKSTLKRTQGVSKNIALSLAKKVRLRLKADIGASLVGFAGPAAKKSVKAGTFFLAVSYKAKTRVKKIILKGKRNQLRRKISQLLIELLYESLYCH